MRPEALDTFHERLRVEPHLRGFFDGDAQIARARGSQLCHWDAISDGRFDETYLQNVKRVGVRHAKIGLAPRWYIGGYALIF